MRDPDPNRFEWDPVKAEVNLTKHGIEFRRAVSVFRSKSYSQPTPRAGEDRWMTVGIVEGRYMTVVWTWRGDAIRVISARRSRDAEIRLHRELYGR